MEGRPLSELVFGDRHLEQFVDSGRPDEAELLARLTTEERNPRTVNIDSLPLRDMLLLMMDEDARVVPAVRAELDDIAAAARVIAAKLGSGGRLFYVGAGTSGRLGVLDAVECPPTFGTDPEQVQAIMAGGTSAWERAKEGAEDDREAGRRDIDTRGVGPKDVVVGIAASGRTPYTIGAMERAKELGAPVIAVVCNMGSPMARVADIAIEPVVGPEVILGSTRLKAGTAQKLVLNMLSTASMILLGKVYSNLMVDLRASNAKLVLRARRIIRLATGCDEDEAARAFEEAGHNAKLAIVMVLAGVGADEARAALAETKGYVRAAVEHLLGKGSGEKEKQHES